MFGSHDSDCVTSSEAAARPAAAFRGASTHADQHVFSEQVAPYLARYSYV